MRQIRVLQIMGKVVGGGVESVILNYYTHLNHDVFYFDFVVDGEPLPYFKDIVKQYGGKIYCITPYEKNIFLYMKDIYYIVKSGEYDIIHSNMNAMSGFSLLPAKLAGAKIRILHNHTTANRGEGAKTALKYILKPFAKICATHYCACSERAARWMYGKAWRKKSHIIYNAIDVEKFQYNLAIRRKFRQQIHCGESQLVVGHVGRFVYQKNHNFLIEVFNKLLTQEKDALLLLIGDGPLKSKIQQKVHILGIEKHVRFLGIQDNVNEWMQAMDIFVFPSWYEGLGMVVIEAQAAGLPTIVSEFVPIEAKCMEIFEVKSIKLGPNAWAEDISKILKKQDRKSKLQFNANYCIKWEVKSLEKYYQSLIDKC